MRLLTCEIHNFGSYEHLKLDDLLDVDGLTLLYGNTGSGKSTIQDMVPWCLFGVTARGGNADEVRSWTSPKELTHGTITVDTPKGTVTVQRSRGPNGKNDLYFYEGTNAETLVRGKDIPDTQRLIDSRLDINADIYLTAAYFQEFSETGQFFNAKAKDRRAVFERIADLLLPTKLASASADDRKATKTALQAETRTFESYQASVRNLTSSIDSAQKRLATWEVDQETAKIAWCRDRDYKIVHLKNSMPDMKFDGNAEEPLAEAKDQLYRLKGATCGVCGSKTESGEREALKDRINALEKLVTADIRRRNDICRINKEISALTAAVNPYQVQSNPFQGLISEQSALLSDAENNLLISAHKVEKLEKRLTGLNRLYDLSSDLRAELLKRSVQEIQTETNRYLETYFDSEIRVTFTVDADNLEVAIQKSGYDCVYRQLSKGQRQLLKLSFACSIMEAAANRAGTHFSHVFFDEGLDGMDTSLKLKAYRLLQDVSKKHEGVLVIDHDESLRTLFDRKFKVTMEADVSSLEET